MDRFIQTAFDRSSGISASLPTYCFGGTVGAPKLAHIVKMQQLISAEAGLSTKFTNVHWYQVIPETELLSLFWLQRQVYKQVMFNEIGTYSLSGSDVVAALNTAAFLGAPEAVWWNQSGSGNPPLAQPLLNQLSGAIQSNGLAFQIYVASSPAPVPDAVSTPFLAPPPC